MKYNVYKKKKKPSAATGAISPSQNNVMSRDYGNM